MNRYSVDFNNMTSGGLIKTRIRRATWPSAAIGEQVVAFDADEDMEFPATVAAFDVNGRVFLDPHWT